MRYCYAVHFEPEMSMAQCLTYGVIISAVDPVAVLAVFEAVNAEKDLYYLVFGEALLNDGVTFVLFEGLKELAKVDINLEIPVESYVYIGLFFLVAPAAGSVIGFILGILTALLTKYTTHDSDIYEPIIVIFMAFIAYFMAITLGFSSIITLIVCGLTQMRYSMPNLTPSNQMTTRSIIKAVATLCEIIIFVLLGSETSAIRIDKCWQFLIAVFIIITVWRLVITFFLVFIINIFRYHPINFKWQSIIFFGGLRGAFAFVMNLEYDGPFKFLFNDSILLIIIITNTINGIAARPLVTFLKLQEAQAEKERTFLSVTSLITSLAAIGIVNLSYNDPSTYLRMMLLKFERNYLFRLVCKDESGGSQLVRDFDEYEQQQALRLIDTHALVGLLHIQQNNQQRGARRRRRDTQGSTETV